MNMRDLVGETVLASTSSGVRIGAGMVIAYCESPMVMIKDSVSGRVFWWRLDQCELVDSDGRSRPSPEGVAETQA